jgi:hypothetical protein
LDELPLSIEIESLIPEDAAGKRKMRASNGMNAPWSVVARCAHHYTSSASAWHIALCLYSDQLNDRDQHHVLVPLTRFYFVDYIVLLMLTVALVVSEMSVPYTRFIFHKDDQVSTSLAFNSPLFAYAPAADIDHHLRRFFSEH